MIKRAGRTRRIGALTLAATLAVAAIAAGKFGTNGKVVTDLGGTNSARAVAIAPDGRIVVAGHSTVDGTFDIAAVRYRKGGGLDSGFGNMGRRIVDLGDTETAKAVLALPNRKIIAAGGSDAGFAADQGTLVRFRRNGGVDSTFSMDGIAQTVLVGGSSIDDVTRQRDGKIVTAGSSGDRMVIARFRPNGALDGSFGAGGIRSVQFDAVTSATGIAVQRSGKIVVAGETSEPGMGAPNRAAFARLRPGGNLDKSFSKDGRRTVKLPPTGHIHDLAVRGKKIYGAGFVFEIGFKRPALIRVGNNGGLDGTFAGEGRKIYKFGANAEINAIAFQGSKLVAVGQRDDPIADFFVARFKSGGGKDRSFSKDGWTSTDFGDGDVALDVAIQNDRRIVAAGIGDDVVALARYKPNGPLDD